MKNKKTIIVDCYYCGNKAPHIIEYIHESNLIYDQLEESTYITEPFKYYMLSCQTCTGLAILGGFKHELINDIPDYPRIYPKGPCILPPNHMIVKGQPIPDRIFQSYVKAWPLRFTAPNAFANQIRRILEMICDQKKAIGDDLFGKLKFLIENK